VKDKQVALPCFLPKLNTSVRAVARAQRVLRTGPGLELQSIKFFLFVCVVQNMH